MGVITPLWAAEQVPGQPTVIGVSPLTPGGGACAVALYTAPAFTGAGPGTPPRFCRTWQGVACDASYHVTGLNLTAVGLAGQLTGLSLSDIALALAPLKYLTVLVLSGLGLSGDLGAPSGSGINAFTGLQHLDISSNPAITGPLPDSWATLTDLRVLDVSGCGLTGSLPGSYASLQQLRELRAANCKGLSGQLPVEFG